MKTRVSSKQETAFFLFKKTWQFASKLRTKYILALTSSLIASIPEILAPFLVALIINEIQGVGINPDNVDHLLFLTALIFIAAVVHSFFDFFGSYYGQFYGIAISNTYKEYLVKGSIGLGLDWHASRDSGDNIDKINNATSAIRSFSSYFYWDIRQAVNVLAGFGAVLYFNLAAGVIAIFVFGIVMYLVFLFDVKLRPLNKEINVMRNKISAKIFDILSNITSVIILRAQKPSLNEMSRSIRAPEKIYKRSFFIDVIKYSFSIVSLQLILVSVLLYFIYAAGYSDSQYEAGFIIALYLYLSKAALSSELLSFRYGIWNKYKVDVENAEAIERDFLEEDKEISLAKDFNEIRIKNLNFFYSDDKEKISGLKDAFLTIKKGEHIAIVGPSGTGKSTLLKVINGLYEGAHCDLTVDGKETKDIDLSEYDLGTMLIPQEPEIFSANIRENITFCSDYQESDIQDAIKLAEFGEVVGRLPKGLESKINEKGVNLSGGEKQRLALARGLLVSQGKSILLLDEATSSVDSKNEVKIYKNILNKFTDKSVVATIHKLNLLRFFDKIVIFKNGAVVGVGTFEELLQSNKDFKRDWEQYITKKEDAEDI